MNLPIDDIYYAIAYAYADKLAEEEDEEYSEDAVMCLFDSVASGELGVDVILVSRTTEVSHERNNEYRREFHYADKDELVGCLFE